MKIHHIGYAVNDIDKAIEEFIKLGYTKKTDKTTDEKRNVIIAFVSNGGYSVELIAPLNDKSPIANILKKNGCTPYHICYETDDIESEIKNLKALGYVILQSALAARAIEDRDVAFLFKRETGLIEIVQKK